MRKQKKTISLFVAIILALSLCISLCVSTAFGGTIGVSGITDTFDGETLDATKWATFGNDGGSFAKLVQKGSLRIENAPANSYVFTKNKVGENGKDLQVEFDVLGYTGSGAILMMMGVNEELSNSMASRGNSYFQLGADNRSLKGGSEAFKGYYQLSTSTWIANNSWGSVGIMPNYRYQFYFFSNGEFKLSIKKLDDSAAQWIEVIRNYGENVNAAAKFTGVGNGRVGFWFDGVIPKLELDNFAVTAVNGDETKNFIDDFEGLALNTEKWETGANVTGGAAYAMQTNSAAESTLAKLVSKTINIDVNNKEKVSSSVSYDLSINKLGADGKFTTYFGLKTAEDFEQTSQNVALTIAAVDGKAVLTAKQNDAALRLTLPDKNTAVSAQLATIASFEKPVNIAFNVINKGLSTEIEVLVGGVSKATVKYVSANGYFGFGVSGETKVTFDNVKTFGVQYAVSEALDQFTDFESAVDEKKWSVETPDEKVMYVKDGKLVFDNAVTGCYFGSTSKYNNFDVSFDISDISYERVFDEENDVLVSDISTWIGICFARETLESTFIDSNIVYLDNNPWKGPSGQDGDMPNGRAVSMLKGALGPISYEYPNIFTKASNEAGGATVRVTAINGTVSLFVRPMNAPLYYLEQPVLVLENVKTNGYLALCCTEGARYKIDNLSIKNLDSDGKTPTVETNGVVLSATSINLTENETVKLSATVTPDTASNKKVIYTSSDASVASVASDGTITAKKAGKATITVTSEDGKSSATCTVTVEQKAIVESSKTSKGCGANAIGASMLAIMCAAGAVVVMKRK